MPQIKPPADEPQARTSRDDVLPERINLRDNTAIPIVNEILRRHDHAKDADLLDAKLIVDAMMQYGIQERIDEQHLEKKAHLFQKKHTAANSGAGRQIASDLQRTDKRIAELTALATMQETHA